MTKRTKKTAATNIKGVFREADYKFGEGKLDLLCFVETYSHRTRYTKKLVLDSYISMLLTLEVEDKFIGEVILKKKDIQELLRVFEMQERQERIDQGELNETDLQISG